MKGNQHFKYLLASKQMFHPVSHQCLDCDPERGEIFMNRCDESKKSQMWTWTQINATLIEERNKQDQIWLGLDVNLQKIKCSYICYIFIVIQSLSWPTYFCDALSSVTIGVCYVYPPVKCFFFTFITQYFFIYFLSWSRFCYQILPVLWTKQTLAFFIISQFFCCISC